MATEKQTAANRRNAQQSTGPRTAEGKARSSQNALQTGIDAQSEIIRGESREKLEALVAQYNQEYCPVTQSERFQVDILVRCTWLIVRYAKAEAQLWEAGMKAAFQATEQDEVGRGFSQREATFTRLGRRVDATRRAFASAQHELERLQAARLAAEAAEAAETEASTGELGSNLTNGCETAGTQSEASGPTPVPPKFVPDSASGSLGTAEPALPKSA
jgi:hypothetical protein